MGCYRPTRDINVTVRAFVPSDTPDDEEPCLTEFALHATATLDLEQNVIASVGREPICAAPCDDKEFAIAEIVERDCTEGTYESPSPPCTVRIAAQYAQPCGSESNDEWRYVVSFDLRLSFRLWPSNRSGHLYYWSEKDVAVSVDGDVDSFPSYAIYVNLVHEDDCASGVFAFENETPDESQGLLWSTADVANEYDDQDEQPEPRHVQVNMARHPAMSWCHYIQEHPIGDEPLCKREGFRPLIEIQDPLAKPHHPEPRCATDGRPKGGVKTQYPDAYDNLLDRVCLLTY